MDKMIKIDYKGLDSIEVPYGTTILEVSKHFADNYKFPILISKVDNDITELSELITRDCQIDFYDRSNEIGNSVYGRGLQFLVVTAVKRLFGSDVEVVIEHSIDKGFYCEVLNHQVNEDIIKELTKEMQKMVEEDLIFTKLSVSRLEAISFFKKRKQEDKAKVLKYISNTFINLYRLDSVYDYYYSYMPYSTQSINDFKLTYIKDNGFVVNYPDIYNYETTSDYKHHKMLFDSFLEYTNWGRTMGIENAADLNGVISSGNYGDLIRLSEAYYDRQLAFLADKINENHNKIKVILLAGPSCSGKTTTSKKLEIYLRSRGLKIHQISTDDYFIDRKHTPVDKNGDKDYETIQAIDVELFNHHLIRLIDGETVLLPEYNFILGKREFKKKYITLEENDIIIIEGIHALNESLTQTIDSKNKIKIYISPLTQLNIDNHNRIHTSDNRKLRRIVRDNRYRNYDASETLNNWKKVREGEEKWIFPYQDEADYVINSALIYELSVLKIYAEPLLFSVSEDDPQYAEAIRLINFLRNFLPMPSEEVPTDSILREFISGSCFND